LASYLVRLLAARLVSIPQRLLHIDEQVKPHASYAACSV
jgi:hypothetical protein